MDEQRMQAYVGLIEQLLGCPQGEENALLQANAELVDAELIEVIGLVTEQMEGQENSNVVWLRQLALQISSKLMGDDLNATRIEASLAFLEKLLKQVWNSKGDIKQLDPFLAEYQHQLDESLLQAIPIEALKLLNVNAGQKHLIAGIFCDFGSLVAQFPLGQRAVNLELALAAYKVALQIFTRESFSELWAMTQNNLANAYTDRILGNHSDNIEQAINAYKLALQVYTRDAFPEKWAEIFNNCALAYRNRIQGDHADNLEQSIIMHESALQVRTREVFPESWARTQMALANAYRDRIRGDRSNNIEFSIASCNFALKIFTYELFPELWAMTQNNLAAAHWRHIQGDRAENIESAIAAFDLVLGFYRCEYFPKDWAGVQNNLGLLYYERIRGDFADNLEKSINYFQLALQIYTRDAYPRNWAATQHNLANSYLYRIKGEKTGNFEQAISAYKNSLEIYQPDQFPHCCRTTARSLANLYADQQNWSAAKDTYCLALTAAENLYRSSLLLSSKIVELFETNDLPRRASYALIHTGQLQKAIEILEQGRARGLSETLERDRANLSQLQQTRPELTTQYQDITTQLHNLEVQERQWMTSLDRHSLTPESLRNTATKLRSELEETIAQIRQVPSYEDFLTPTKWEDIAISLRRDNPLVYLVTTPNGSMALTVTVDEIDHVWLDGFNETQLIELLENTWLSTYRNWVNEIQRLTVVIKELKENSSEANRHTYEQADSVYKQAEADWHDAIDTTTRQLWDSLMGPLIQQIKALGFDHITIIPTGYLSLLPLHAAWTPDPSKPTGRSYALDDLHITYAPNAKSLIAAQSIADRVQADSILAIDNPSQDLLNSEREIQTAIASFLPQATILRHHHATTTAVKAALPQDTIAHFSCHGTANLNEPLNSGLAMSDGLLTLKDIFALNLAESGGLRLAILSACETGIQGLENADEAVSLPTGLLQAGVAAVIASLWSVSDLSTMILLVRFYDYWRNENLAPAAALRQAQQWVRDTTNEQKYNYLKDAFQKLVNTQQISAQEVDGLLREFMFRYTFPDGPQGKSFAHPFHWAAFSYTGV
jgi:CHAT domain-containing protein